MDRLSSAGSHTPDDCPLVPHTFCCIFWSPQSEEMLCPIRECWYCKYSDFRKDAAVVGEYSPCHHPHNRIKPLVYYENQCLEEG